MHNSKATEWTTEDMANKYKEIISEDGVLPLTFIVDSKLTKPRVFGCFTKNQSDIELFVKFTMTMLSLWEAEYYGILTEAYFVDFSDKEEAKQWRGKLHLHPRSAECLIVGHVKKNGEKRLSRYRIKNGELLSKIDDQNAGDFGGRFFSLFETLEPLEKTFLIPPSVMELERRLRMEEKAQQIFGLDVAFQIN